MLASNEVQRHKTSKKELDKLRAVIARDFADASLDGVTAYNAGPAGRKNGDCMRWLPRRRSGTPPDFF